MIKVHAPYILLQFVKLMALGSTFPVGAVPQQTSDYSFLRSMRFMKSA